MRVVFHYAAGSGLRERLEAFSGDGLEIAVCPEDDDELLARLLAEVEVLWHVLRPLTAEHIAAAPRLRLIQKIGVGVNTIDLDAARARGIAVCNLPGTNSRAVAELTLALMLAALRRIPSYDRATRDGQGWSLSPDVQDRLGELGGRTVGLVGYGAVPRLLAPILVALGSQVVYTAGSPKHDAVGEWRSLPELLAEADVVSLHLPLTPQTERLLDAAAFATMRPGAVLVNTARGGLVDEPALVEALRSGHLRAAALDVFAREPVATGSELLSLENVVVMPHVAWLTPETFDRSLELAAENCRRLRSGEALLNRVV
ncbi:MAG: 2-hydroxyacid dehydrogenase [Gaiellales bacterium]